MGALPQHVPADLDPRERHGTKGVGRVDDLELEPIGRLIFEGALEIERLERAVRVLARPHLRRDALPVSEHRLLDLRYVCFHAACLRLIAGGLRRGSAKSCHHQKQQQRRSNAFTHADTPVGSRAGLRAEPTDVINGHDTLCLPGRPRVQWPFAIEAAGRLEKDFVSWPHACETWEDCDGAPASPLLRRRG